jgi:hypothetical protein
MVKVPVIGWSSVARSPDAPGGAICASSTMKFMVDVAVIDASSR